MLVSKCHIVGNHMSYISYPPVFVSIHFPTDLMPFIA